MTVCITILGTHRSGSSLLASVSEAMGAWFGTPADDLKGPGADASNPKGHWERRDLLKACDIALRGSGHAWWKILDFDPENIPPATLEELRPYMASAAAALGTHPVTVVKNPRLCLLLPVLLPMLPGTAKPCILALRNPVEVAQSLLARDRFFPPVGLALWELYTRAALRHSTGLPRMAVDYADMLSHPEREARRLQAYLEPYAPGMIRFDVNAVRARCDPELHRQKSTGAPPPGSGPYLDLYERIKTTDDWTEIAEESPLAQSVVVLRAFEPQYEAFTAGRISRRPAGKLGK